MAKKTEDLITKYGLDGLALSRLSTYLTWVKDSDLFKAVATFLLPARSDVEMKYRLFGKALVEKQTGRKVVFSGYEWFSFRLPGGTYKPDWCYLLDTGQWAIVEVKQSKFARGYRDQRAKLRAAATLNPWFLFYEIRPEKGEWTVEHIPPDDSFLRTFTQTAERLDNVT